MKILRTPDERFLNLPDYPFKEHFCDIDDTEGGKLRVHYVDEGNAGSDPILLMHGEPSWSYLYRKMIPILSKGGFRVIAPDLVGFGKSDKPSDRNDYSYRRHVDWMADLLFNNLNLERITLFCQDWGGLVGLRLVANSPDRFSRIVAANTGLPTGDQPMTDAFKMWRDFSQQAPELPIGKIISGGCTSKLAPETIAAYDAPFPDETFKEGARIFPALVPSSPEDPAHDDQIKAWEVFYKWDKPFMTAFSDGDPITRGGHTVFQNLVPGAKNVEHRTVNEAGHFLQEDKGDEVAQIILNFVSNN